jgi:geranylgeranyl pyrophosphate synthase
LKKYDSIDYATKIAKRMLEEAKPELHALKESDEKTALLSVCEFIIKRES